MTENKRFRVTLGNNTVRFVDFEENKQLMSISFKKHNDAVDCQNALKFQCDLLNEFNNQADAVRTELQLCEEENNELQKENKQLKQRCKELRNDLIDHSALINMLEKARALDIEDMIWNTMDYKTQTEFDDDFADYREDAKKRWRE